MKRETLIKLIECEQVVAIDADAKTIEVMVDGSEGLSNVWTALKDEHDFEGWTMSINPYVVNIEERDRIMKDALMESVANTIGFGRLRKMLGL